MTKEVKNHTPTMSGWSSDRSGVRIGMLSIFVLEDGGCDGGVSIMLFEDCDGDGRSAKMSVTLSISTIYNDEDKNVVPTKSKNIYLAVSDYSHSQGIF